MSRVQMRVGAQFKIDGNEYLAISHPKDGIATRCSRCAFMNSDKCDLVDCTLVYFIEEQRVFSVKKVMDDGKIMVADDIKTQNIWCAMDIVAHSEAYVENHVQKIIIEEADTGDRSGE
jgi:hypothetical protein